MTHEFPAHMPYFGAIVGPLVRFRSQQVPVSAAPPRDTHDPRWNNCTDHHLACDCREAEQNEMLNELRSEWKILRDAMDVMIAGHATKVDQYDQQPRPDLECQCQLCDFARKTGLVPFKNRRTAYESRRRW
ncbi:hypothetical protein ACWGK5_32135 [Rhodococcus qingshengii]